ncbi:MAG: CCA tRNA nucleotidyltransferase [Chloroflexi bacterium]|nr:CCA tRNA nucleotidyltransferase [Chloroflexota bacterium]
MARDNSLSEVDLAPYQGRWVAIVRKQITGVGLSEQQARLASKFQRPKEDPEVIFVPEDFGKMDILEKVTAFLAKRNSVAYLVGGAVRDQLLGRAETRDIDLAIVGDASGLARAFANAEGGAFYLMDAEHNVARVLLGKVYVDFAALRGSLEADLATRDFTINAMARAVASSQMSVASTVADPFHGLEDLRAKRVRAVSDSVFQHDPVRLLRAVRIAGELNMAVEPQTATWMRRDAALLANASMERARDELFKILALPNVMALLRQLDELGLLAALLPQVSALRGVAQSAPHDYDAFEHTMRTLDALVAIQARGYAEVANGEFVAELNAHFAQQISADRTRGALLRFATLAHDIGKAVTGSVDETGTIHFYEHEPRGAKIAETICRRLRLSNDEIAIVARTIEHHLRPAQLARATKVTNRAIYRYFRDTGDVGIDICVLALADWRAKSAAAITDPRDGEQRSTLATMLDRYYRAPQQVVTPPALVDGRTLMRELNIPPGPRVGELLEAIREAQAGGEVKTREDALALARERVER